MWPRWLLEALSGKVSLSRAFWLYGVGISVAYSVIGAWIDAANGPAVAAYVIVGFVLGVLQTIILWRSAANARSRFLGRLVRTSIVLGFVIVVVVLYVLLANWSSLAAA